jgi:hypothetical protein
MNDAFLASKDSLEVEQNYDDTVDDRVEVEVNSTDPDDVYANKESESLETNISHLILLIDCL